MKWLIITIMACFSAISVSSQDIYYTKNGQISFYSKAPLENIEAHNNEVASFVDIKKNEIAFSLLVKSFHFEKALMEEHFNENYMESDKYPKATFKGKVTDAGNLNLNADGNYKITVEGTLTIHNVSNKVKTDATVIIKNKEMSGQAKFNVRLADYQIKIPSVVSQNIAEIVEVSVNCHYSQLKK